ELSSSHPPLDKKFLHSFGILMLHQVFNLLAMFLCLPMLLLINSLENLDERSKLY
uniref:Uncharacterized protein n=1 Tax=Musa acuminata subsp. malaccensis TaxID=214687 RepID=A0A804JDB0_MUSAM